MKILQIIKIIKIMAKFLLLSLLVLGLGIYSGCGSDGTGTGGAVGGGAGGGTAGGTRVKAIAAIPSNGFYVKVGGSDTKDGSSWENAFGDLQSAIDAAAAHDTRKTVYVAQGTYKPNDKDPTNMAKDQHFALKNGVTVIGGYPGLKDDELNAVDPSKTILSGDLAGNDIDGTNTNKDDNVYHVFYHPEAAALAKTAKLENVTITKGNAYGTSDIDKRGGGMHNNGSSPTLNGVTFTNNTANNGGGMFNNGSSPTLDNVNFNNNNASSGGGMANASNSKPTLTNVSFTNNTATNGGGMYNENSSPNLDNVTFTNNTVTNNGGGMANASNSKPTLSNVDFTSNKAPFGGGMSNGNSSPTLNNVTFTNNIATDSGGGMYNWPTSNPSLTGCTFTGNTATNAGGAMYSDNTSTPNFADNPLTPTTAEASKTNGYYKAPQ